jgi:hypothetical protein
MWKRVDLIPYLCVCTVSFYTIHFVFVVRFIDGGLARQISIERAMETPTPSWSEPWSAKIYIFLQIFIIFMNVYSYSNFCTDKLSHSTIHHICIFFMFLMVVTETFKVNQTPLTPAIRCPVFWYFAEGLADPDTFWQRLACKKI